MSNPAAIPPKGDPVKAARAREAYRPISDMIKIELATQMPNKRKGYTKARAIAAKLVAEALKGVMPALKEVADRMEGRPANTEGAQGPVAAVQIIINSEDAKVL